MEKCKKIKLFKRILLLIIVFCSSCFAYFYGTSIYLIREIEIPKDVQTKIWDAEEIDFSQTINGQWDSLIILHPYIDAKTVKQNFNVNLNRLENKSIEYIDGQALFLFCEKNNIETYFYVKYPIEIDYESFPDYERIPRNESVFSSIQEGETWKLVKINKE